VTSSSDPNHGPMWLRYVPSVQWLAGYRIDWLGGDIVAGITLAAYAIPVSLAYAALAGLPPQVGVYGYLLGGLGYAIFGSSRHLAVGPTSAISLMVAGTVGAMAEGVFSATPRSPHWQASPWPYFASSHGCCA
jgi:MFS superfamily sulfate permease-like transporter